MFKKLGVALVVAIGLSLIGAGAASADAGSTGTDGPSSPAAAVRQWEQAQQELMAAIEQAQKAEAEGRLDGFLKDLKAPEDEPQYASLSEWWEWYQCMLGDLQVAWDQLLQGNIERAIKIALNADDWCGLLYP